jgi:hypothetical protein
MCIVIDLEALERLLDLGGDGVVRVHHCGI